MPGREGGGGGGAALGALEGGGGGGAPRPMEGGGGPELLRGGGGGGGPPFGGGGAVEREPDVYRYQAIKAIKSIKIHNSPRLTLTSKSIFHSLYSSSLLDEVIDVF